MNVISALLKARSSLDWMVQVSSCDHQWTSQNGAACIWCGVTIKELHQYDYRERERFFF